MTTALKGNLMFDFSDFGSSFSLAVDCFDKRLGPIQMETGKECVVQKWLQGVFWEHQMKT